MHYMHSKVLFHSNKIDIQEKVSGLVIKHCLDFRVMLYFNFKGFYGVVILMLIIYTVLPVVTDVSVVCTLHSLLMQLNSSASARLCCCEIYFLYIVHAATL